MGAVGAATAVLGFRTDRGPRDDPPPVAAAPTAPAPQARAEPRAPIDPDDPATADLFAGKVVDAEGKPLDGAKIYVVPKRAAGARAPPTRGSSGRSPRRTACSDSRRKT